METSLEYILTHSYKTDMIAYLNSHPDEFEEAINLATGNKSPYSWRAASAIWGCLEVNDERIKKYISNIINALTGKEDGHQRELLKILQIVELNEEDESLLFDFCITIWESITKQPSVRFNAFRMIVKIINKHPELLNEFRFLTQERYLETLSPGAKHSINRIISSLYPNYRFAEQEY